VKNKLIFWEGGGMVDILKKKDKLKRGRRGMGEKGSKLVASDAVGREASPSPLPLFLFSSLPIF
jgi:hypothetical protein